MLVVRTIGGTVIDEYCIGYGIIAGSIEWFHQGWLIDELNNAMGRRELVS